MRSKISEVWQHFSLDTAHKKDFFARFAKQTYHGSTSVMHEHLKRKHAGQLNGTKMDRGLFIYGFRCVLTGYCSCHLVLDRTVLFSFCMKQPNSSKVQ